MSIAPKQQSSHTDHIWTSRPNGQRASYSDPEYRFTLIAADGIDPQRFMHMDAYSAAMAFVKGKFEIHGEVFEAVRYFSKQHHSALRELFFSTLARLERLRTAAVLGYRRPAARSIQFHYDRSNEFYSQFLDSRMMYSAAHFNGPEDSLETAQQLKLEMICRDLALQPDDRFLDIGCGWGGLVIYAAEHFGAKAVGCTLAEGQYAFALQSIERHSLQEQVAVSLRDYRDIAGTFDKIASVGMFEHVGRSRLAGYFKKAFELLKPGGLFLNRGVVRPQNVSDGPDSLFLQKHLFPGGQLVHLADVIREGERAGFDVIGVRNLRKHYSLTCKAWVNNLQTNAASCRAVVGDRTYRTWLLYLAASAVAFEDGRTGAAQVLFLKPR